MKLIPILALLALVGCNFPTLTERIEANKARFVAARQAEAAQRYGTWYEAASEAERALWAEYIRDGTIVLGMSWREVRAVLGTPDNVHRRVDSWGETVWWDYDNGGGYYVARRIKRSVTFEQGVVSSVFGQG